MDRNRKNSPARKPQQSSRVTATEIVSGVLCRITLERDDTGRYREIMLTPIASPAVVRD